MKNKFTPIVLAFLSLMILDFRCPAFSLVGTAFTYQGRLNDGLGPANGIYDLSFSVYDSTNLPGTLIAGPLTNSATAISNGLFTVTLDFGTNVFNGTERWLEIGVRTNGASSFVTLVPRQKVTPTPYALMSLEALQSASLLGTLPASQLPAGVVTNNQSGVNLSGSFAGNGGGLTNLNATTLGGSSSNGFWSITGNAGTTPGANFIGTSDNQNLVIKGHFVGIGRTNPLTANEFFGVNALSGTGNYGGMYVNSDLGGLPFYGYARAGVPAAYHYIDTGDGNKWKLSYGLTVTPSGFVGIGTSSPSSALTVLGQVAVSNTVYAGGLTLNTGAGIPSAFYIDDTNGERAALAVAEGPGNYSSSAQAGDVVLRALTGNLFIQSGGGAPTITVPTNGGLFVTGPLSVNDPNDHGGDISLPFNTVIYSGSETFIHNYGFASGNFFAGESAGNLTNPGGAYDYDTGVGAFALNLLTSGFDNTALGGYSLYHNASGYQNTAVGFSSLEINSVGYNNTAVGYGAGSNLTGNNNTVLGAGAGTAIAGDNNVCIANGGTASDNNVIRIGTQGVHTNTYISGIFGTTTGAGVPVYVDFTGHLGTAISSSRFKENIHDMGDASDALLTMRPVTFRYKPELDPKGASQFGLVAEEVAKINPDLVARDEKGEIYTVRYDAVNAMLLNEFLKEHRKVEDLQARLEKLEQLIKSKKEDIK